MLVWGNYCNVTGGAVPVNIYYSTDNGGFGEILSCSPICLLEIFVISHRVNQVIRRLDSIQGV